MGVFYFDPLYLLFALPAFILGLTAQGLLKFWTGKYSKVRPMSGFNGAQVVEKIVNSKGFDVSFSLTDQKLGDHYDPRAKNVALSREIAQNSSLTSVGIAAHELGHVEQHYVGSALIKFRTFFMPIVGISTNIGYFLLVIGIILGFANLSWLGIILFSASAVFSVITLPIELDASKRALKLLQSENILLPQEIPAVKKVLSAAALTYVAATVQSLSTLAYFILRTQGIKRD